MNQTPLEGIAPAGLELAFIHRVYRTSLVALGVCALLVWERFGRPAALGWIAGGILGLAILASVEWSVRRYFQPGSQPSGTMVLISVLKLPLTLAYLALLWFAARHRWILIAWVGIGFPLPGIITVLKLVGQKLTGPRA